MMLSMHIFHYFNRDIRSIKCFSKAVKSYNASPRLPLFLKLASGRRDFISFSSNFNICSVDMLKNFLLAFYDAM